MTQAAFELPPGKEDERGIVVVIVALCAVLIVIFAIGLSIDIPTTQSVVLRTQAALDNGAKTGMSEIIDYSKAASLTYSVAQDTLRNALVPRLRGYEWGLASPSLNIDVVVPRPGESLAWFRCSNGNCNRQGGSPGATEPFATALQTVFPESPIDDFKNAVFAYGTFQPPRYLPTYTGTAPVSVASTVMLNTALTYVLVDPSFTVDDQDTYNYLFGAQVSSAIPGCDVDPDMWPLHNAANQRIGAWSYPAQSGLLTRKPVSGLARTNGASDLCISRFYAATCDSSPFVAFKEGAVGLIDRLTQSSAFNSTTLVGLFGYRERLGPQVLNPTLVPIHPLFAVPGPSPCPDKIASHRKPTGPTFPLQINGGAENAGLHSLKREAFHGFVNSRYGWLGANRTRACGSASAGNSAGTGLNRWELCYCRGLYTASGVGQDFLTLDDVTPDDEDVLSHRDPNKRRRSQLVNNWCDDASNGADDAIIDLPESRNGSNAGDSARNLIAQLAIRFEDSRIDRLDREFPCLDDGAGGTRCDTWQRPRLRAGIRTGWRDLMQSMDAATTEIVRAEQEYAASDMGKIRRIANRWLVALAFGAWSSTTLKTRVDEEFATSTDPRRRNDPNTLRAEITLRLKNEFRESLRQKLIVTVCNAKIGVIFGFLPMSAFDKDTVRVTAEFAKQLESIYRAQANGSAPNPLDIPDFADTACTQNTIAPVYFLVFDSELSPYSTSGATNQQKLDAATAFGREMPDIAMQLLSRYGFSL